MAYTSNGTHVVVVELTPGVYVRTAIPVASHAALRAGFAGYTSNPRWNAAKFHAWKVGRQWRDALARQEMVVRETDSMLVSIAEAEVVRPEPSNEPSETKSVPKKWFSRKGGAIASNFA